MKIIIDLDESDRVCYPLLEIIDELLMNNEEELHYRILMEPEWLR